MAGLTYHSTHHAETKRTARRPRRSGSPVATLHAQNVTKETLPGVTNFAKLETTIACAGATTPAAVAGLKQMGYASIINLREASEPAPRSTLKPPQRRPQASISSTCPSTPRSPNPAVVDSFLKAVTDAKNQPAFVHCASANRAAAMWMIKRMQVDKWDADRAGTEAGRARADQWRAEDVSLNYVASARLVGWARSALAIQRLPLILHGLTPIHWAVGRRGHRAHHARAPVRREPASRHLHGPRGCLQLRAASYLLRARRRPLRAQVASPFIAGLVLGGFLCRVRSAADSRRRGTSACSTR